MFDEFKGDKTSTNKFFPKNMPAHELNNISSFALPNCNINDKWLAKFQLKVVRVIKILNFLLMDTFLLN
jgi:hypothetical protein